MTKKRINAILWRSYLSATSAALWGTNKSQYYFALSKDDYSGFFGNRATQSIDAQQNSVYTICLEPYEGMHPAGPYDLSIIKLRDDAARSGEWQMIDQSVERAYALWRKARGPVDKYENLPPAERSRNFIVIARDVDFRFHGRWIRGSDFATLPTAIQELLTKKSVGWSTL